MRIIGVNCAGEVYQKRINEFPMHEANWKELKKILARCELCEAELCSTTNKFQRVLESNYMKFNETPLLPWIWTRWCITKDLQEKNCRAAKPHCWFRLQRAVIYAHCHIIDRHGGSEAFSSRHSFNYELPSVFWQRNTQWSAATPQIFAKNSNAISKPDIRISVDLAHWSDELIHYEWNWMNSNTLD